MRKKKLCLILVFALVLMVAGCKDGSDESVINQGTENDVNNNTNDDINNDINAGNDNGSNNGNNTGQGNQGVNSQDQTQSNSGNKNPKKDYLSSNELLWFTEVYFNDRNNSIVDRFLCSTFETVTEIDYNLIFQFGTFSEESGDVSWEERELIAERYSYADTFLEAVKFTTEELESIVREYTNLSISETKQIGLEDYFYLEEYDAYYRFFGDAFFEEFVFYSGWRNDDGTITLQYMSPTWEEAYDVTLRPHEEGYFFVSNMKAKEVIAKEETGLDPHRVRPDYVRTEQRDYEQMNAFCEQFEYAYSGVMTYYSFTTGEAKFDLYERIEVSEEENPIGWEYIEVDEKLLQMTENCEIWFVEGAKYSKIKLIDLEELVECGFMEMHVFEVYIEDGKIQCLREIMMP